MGFDVHQLDDGQWQVVCACGRGIKRGVNLPWRHHCATTGQMVMYTPEGFVWQTPTQPERPPRDAIDPLPATLVQHVGPGYFERARNFSTAAAAHRRAGRPKATDEQVAERFAICQTNACGLYKAIGEGSGTCLHKTCGCNLRAIGNEALLTPNKLRWADQACPVGKWPAVKNPLQATKL